MAPSLSGASRSERSPAHTSLAERFPRAWQEMRETAALAWQRGLLAGFNGNLSVRVDNSACLVTRSGVAKGALTPEDLCLVAIADAKRLEGGKPSSELAMHLAIYREQPHAQAVLHTHPPYLLALGLRLPVAQRLRMAVHEAGPLREELAFCPEQPPGSAELAEAAGKAAHGCRALWLECHGLTVWGASLHEALARSEELDHLARIQLLAL